MSKNLRSSTIAVWLRLLAVVAAIAGLISLSTRPEAYAQTTIVVTVPPDSVHLQQANPCLIDDSGAPCRTPTPTPTPSAPICP